MDTSKIVCRNKTGNRSFLLIGLFGLMLPLLALSQVKTLDINLENYNYHIIR